MKTFSITELVSITQGTSANPKLIVEISDNLEECYCVYFLPHQILLFDSWFEKDDFLEKHFG